MPIDLVPDFIPVAGPARRRRPRALVLRSVLRSSSEVLMAEHWPGAAQSLGVIRRLAYGAPR